MQKLSKESFIDAKEKQGINKEELLAKWAEFEQQFKEQGMKEPELSERVKRRMQSWFILQAQTPGVDVKAILIGAHETDFGARKTYNAATELFKKDPDAAIRAGITTPDGKPLSQKGFRAGQVIDLKNSLTRIFMGIFQVGDSKEWVKGELSSKEKVMPELFSLLEFNAGKAKKSTAEHINLFATAKTKFVVKQKLNDKEVLNILTSHYKDKLAEIRNLPEVINKNQSKFDEFSIVKGDVVRFVDDDRSTTDSVTGEQRNKQNMLQLNSNDDEPVVLTGYCMSDLKFNFSQDAIGVIVIGRPYLRQTDEGDQLSMAIMGVYAPEEFRVKKQEYKEPEVVEAEEEKATEPNEEGW
jgi:hypothetical protein